MTKVFAENRIAILMGGRVAEEIIFDQITTGFGICDVGDMNAKGPFELL